MLENRVKFQKKKNFLKVNVFLYSSREVFQHSTWRRKKPFMDLYDRSCK